MATIKLSDQLGAVVDVQPAETSALLRYFRALPALAMQNGDLTQAGGLTLDQPAVRDLALAWAGVLRISEGAAGPAFTAYTAPAAGERNPIAADLLRLAEADQAGGERVEPGEPS